MKRTLIVATLAVMGLMSSTRPAQANILDWMQEWSGPGPFDFGGHVAVTKCRALFDATNERSQNEHPCLFVDFRRLVPDEKYGKDNFPVRVTATFLDAGWTWRLRRYAEIGVGAGIMTAAGSKTAVRPTITFPRIVIEPVTVFVKLFNIKDDAYLLNVEPIKTRLYHTFKFYARGNFIAFNLNGDDLGVSGTNYSRTFEYVVSRGLFVDVGELFFPQRTK